MASIKENISHDLKAGELLCERYRIRGRIADGGMASIYLADDEASGKPVAIKALYSYYSDNRVVRTRFLDEGRIQSMLEHPNILSVYEVVHKPLLAFIMEYVDGPSLETYLQDRGPLDELALVDITLPILSAVGFAHSKGIIHRDLKPSNVLLCKTTQGFLPKVLDFGVAKVNGARELTAAGTTVGTLHYMSPEQIVGSRTIDGRADIYSLGVTMYKLLTGVVPFNASTEFALMMAQVEAVPRPPRQLRHDLSERIEAIILKALAKEPAQRYQSIRDFASDLIDLRQELLGHSESLTAPLSMEIIKFAMLANEVARDRTDEYSSAFLQSRGLPPDEFTSPEIALGHHDESTREMGYEAHLELSMDARRAVPQDAVQTMPVGIAGTGAGTARIDDLSTIPLTRPSIVAAVDATANDRIYRIMANANDTQESPSPDYALDQAMVDSQSMTVEKASLRSRPLQSAAAAKLDRGYAHVDSQEHTSLLSRPLTANASSPAWHGSSSNLSEAVEEDELDTRVSGTPAFLRNHRLPEDLGGEQLGHGATPLVSPRPRQPTDRIKRPQPQGSPPLGHPHTPTATRPGVRSVNTRLDGAAHTADHAASASWIHAYALPAALTLMMVVLAVLALWLFGRQR